MSKKQTDKDVKIIIQYESKNDTKDIKSFQNVMETLFASYIIRVMQMQNKKDK